MAEEIVSASERTVVEVDMTDATGAVTITVVRDGRTAHKFVLNRELNVNNKG